MSKQKYNLPKIEFVTLSCCCCFGPLTPRAIPEVHRKATPKPENPFSPEHRYRITMFHGDEAFSGEWYDGAMLYDLAKQLGDEAAVLTSILKEAAEKKKASGRYLASISVMSKSQEFALAIVDDDGKQHPFVEVRL